LGPLAGDATAVVVGGGPSGVAAAIALVRGARDQGRRFRVVIVEGKQFAAAGHHNQCVGVLSPPIADLMQAELGIAFPLCLARVRVGGYVLHTPEAQIVLDGTGEPTWAMRRIQFDSFMLDAAQAQGVEVVSARLTEVEFHADYVVVYTDQALLRADVVVGAFGLDEGASAIFARATGYRAPPTLSAVVTKFHPGDAAIAAFGSRVHAFLPACPAIEFGAITPKGNHLTLNIAGGAVDSRHMDAFLRLPEVRRALPGLENAGRYDPHDLRFFRGRFPNGLARGYSGDRFVMVGDAAGLVRAFKGKGVTSGIQTGIRAAHVILREGFSAAAFRAYHAANQDIVSDLPYGQTVRHLAILASRLGLMTPVVRAARHAPRLRRALFEAVSGIRPYREVMRDVLSLDSVAALARAAGMRRW
jgi:flavin-dependent dehydrogenase